MSEQKQVEAGIERMLDRVVWVKVVRSEPIDELHVTHEGKLKIGEHVLRCYALSDGRRVFDSDDVHAFFSFIEGGD